MYAKPSSGYRDVFLRRLVVLSLLLALGLVFGVSQAHAVPGAISGTVTAAGGGTLADISVQSWVQNVDGGWDFGPAVLTDAVGTYTLPVEPGTYRVLFYDGSGIYLGEFYDGSPTEAGATPIIVADGALVPGIDATLDLAGHISGTVTELAGGAPLADVSVAVYEFSAGVWTPYTFTLTDVDGFYDIGGLPTGLYRVQFVDGTLTYAPEYYDGAFSLSAATPVAVTAPDTTSFIDAALSAAGTISGTVTAADLVTPVADVMVVAYQNVVGDTYEWQSEPAWTDANGNYTITGLPSGDFTVGFFDTSGLYVPQVFYDGAYLLSSGTPVSVTVGADTNPIDAVLEAYGTVAGTVTAAGTGLPLEGEWVEVFRDNAGVWELMAELVTLPDGSYDTGPLPPGTYIARFGATSIAYQPEYYDGVLLEADATPFAVVPGVTTTGIDASLDPNVTVTATGVDKIYDGTTTAEVTLATVGVDPGDDVTATYVTAVFDDKNVGTGKTVSVTGIALSGADAGKYQLLDTTASTTADITALEISGAFTAADKVFDGTTDATVLTRSVVGAITGDDVVLSGGTASFDTPDVGANKTVTLTGATLSGADAGNYTLSAAPIQTTADITAATATVTITGAVAVSKTYDGTTDATVDFTAATLVGVTPGDVVTIDSSAYTASFDTMDVGVDKPVTVAGVVLAGADAGNYTLTQPTGLTADITAAGLTVSAAVAIPKTYDGTTDATVDFTLASLTGVVLGDVVTIDSSAYTASFDTKDVGVDKPVTVAGVALAGADAGNYTLTQPAGLTADITALEISGAFTAADKVFDGTTDAVVLTRSLVGAITGDDVVLSGGTASFDTPDVGVNKTVTLTGATLSGVDAGNYTLSAAPIQTTADITAATATVTITGAVAVSKTYDGTTDATVDFTAATLVGVTPGDIVTIDSSAYTASFDTKDVGVDKPVTVAGVALAGADAGNYTLTQPAGLTADITALEISGAFTAADKVFDGTTDAVVLTRSLVGAITGDDVVLSGGTASFDTPDVGVNKTVTLTGATLSGVDAGNYTLSAAPIQTTADITPRPITVTANDASKAVGSADPVLTYTVTSGSLVSGDGFTGVLSRAPGEVVGTYPIAQGTLALTANYNITFVGATFTITSTPVDRLSGGTRYTTSIAIAAEAYPSWTGVTHVILASGEDRAQPDVLTAAGLAGVLDAPLLLVPSASVSADVEDALRGMPTGVIVHIVGGPIAVSSNVENQVRAYPNVAGVDRVAGPDRYSTAAEVARRMEIELVAQGQTLPTTTLITNGNTPGAMFDALAASAISAHNHFPVLLVRLDSVPAETTAVLNELDLTNRYIVGGTAAISNGVASSLGVSASNRIAGATRYSTATAAATRAKTEGWLTNSILGLAARIPDAATGGAYMGRLDGALVYVTTAGVPAETASYLTAVKDSVDSAMVFGGTTVIPETVRIQIQNLIN